MRYKLTLAYCGTNYCGFQSQINGLSIQDVLEKVLSKLFNEKIRLVMSSRTDAGVHAKGQVVHFDTDKIKELTKLKYACNCLLPKDIHVLKIEEVDENFHARYSVKYKTYHYLINIGEADVFLNNLVYQCPYPLDLPLMKKGAELLVGEHDFTSFNTTELSEHPNQVRKIMKFEIEKKDDILTFEVMATGFLRNMVRIMVGTLIDLGRGKKTLADIQEMLDVPCKSKRRYNAPACGLYLMNIKY